MGKINHRKCIVDGIEFDSSTEADYYLFLKSNENVKDIILQPQYVLAEAFQVSCSKCKGEGKTPSPKTGKPVNCRTCRGTGERTRQAWTYKADFRVIYQDGYEEVIDVKGWANERFPLVKKMWELQNGKELIVIEKKKGVWKRR